MPFLYILIHLRYHKYSKTIGLTHNLHFYHSKIQHHLRIQIYFYYNRIFFPRDSKDQIKFCKKKKVKKNVKGDIIFWRGHVGICLNNSKFIHAYGPRKKVVIMPTKFTIDLIYKTANLVVKKISNIKNY